MPFRTRSIIRETGAALAVVAVYMLVLLAPLHRSAGLQRDLADLGYAPLDTSSICTSLAQSNDDTQQAVVKCAAAGIGKNELASVEPVAIEVGIVRIAMAVEYAAPRTFPPATARRLSAQPRAPPVTA
jgi:hypothetical protein